MDMNMVELGIKALNILVRFIPPEKHPPVDYSDLSKLYIDHYDKRIEVLGTAPVFGTTHIQALNPAPAVAVAEPPAPVEVPIPGEKKKVATSCIACSRSHLATIAGALEESLRFARESGVTDPEVIKRLDIAEREINILERIDLSAEAIQNSEVKDQKLAYQVLPKIRKLRQDIGQIADVNKLESTAAEASVLTHEFRLAHMQSQGANLNPIIQLAREVESGEKTIEQAREEVKQYLPKDY
jgi:hypothetical protein